MTRAFLDANIAIYAAGRPHPLKEPCARIVTLVARHPGAFVTDAEVLQELLHRFLALRMWPDPGRHAFTHFADTLRDRVEPMLAGDVEAAAQIANRHPQLAARDLVHLAVMERLGIAMIVSADKDFDSVPEVERLDPAEVDAWQERVLT